MSSSSFKSSHEFFNVKIGKDMYPYLKRYCADVFGDANSVSVNHSHVSRKLCYLFIKARNHQIPLLSELLVTVKTVLEHIKSPCNAEKLHHEVLQVYKKLIERVVPLTAQASPIFASDSILNNPRKNFVRGSSYIPYFIDHLLPYVNPSNFITGIDLETPDEFYNLLIPGKALGDMDSYFPVSITRKNVLFDREFILDDSIDDSDCKEIIFTVTKMSQTLAVSDTVAFSVVENEVLQKTAVSSDVAIFDLFKGGSVESLDSLVKMYLDKKFSPEFIEEISKPVLSLYFKKYDDVLTARMTAERTRYESEVNVRLMSIEGKLEERIDKKLIRIDKELNKKLNSFYNRIVDVISRITIKIPYFQRMLPEPDNSNDF